MASVKLTQEKPLRAFWQNQYRNLLLKPAFKLLRNRGDLPSFWTMPHDTICREILTHGFYERELLTGMVALVKENGTALDIGANIGNHTVFFSRHFERVLSFEPVPSNCLILRANLHLNSIKNVTLVEKGLGRKATKLSIYHDDPQNTNNGLIEASDPTGSGLIEVARGDEELQHHGIDGKIVMMKIDVEGAEPGVILGLEQTIKHHRPLIYWEAFTEETVNQSKSILEAYGYEHFYHLSTNKHRKRLLNKIQNAFGKAVYLKPLNECESFDGMNVASPRPLI